MERLDERGLRAVSSDLSGAAWLVVAGLVLVTVELRIGDLDLLNAVIGAASVAYAAHRLLRLDVPAAVRAGLRVARAVAALTAAVVAASEVVAPRTTAALGPDALVVPTRELALLAARVVAEAALLVVLAVAFQRVSRWATLERAARSWWLSLRLIVIVLVPAVVGSLLLVALHRRGLVDAAARPWLSTAVLAGIYLPVVHLVVSLVRTAREAHTWRGSA